MNGAGKSTVLQFIDFLSQLVRGDMMGWLNERKWKSADLKSKLTGKEDEDVKFCVRFVDEQGNPAGRWEASYSLENRRCTQERIDLLDHLLKIKKDNIEITDVRKGSLVSYPITFDYEGSILSALKEEFLPPSILECKNLFCEVRSLDLLAPERLRQRTREAFGSLGLSLGLGGQNLSAFLHEMNSQKRLALVEKLNGTNGPYPHLQGLNAKSLQSGWKQFEISERYEGLVSTLNTEARHINDGMLRLIAILAELQSEHRFLLFDEIENGINPEVVEFVLHELVTTPKQVMVTTHSPMILNYLEDDVARKGVLYLYKTRFGHTHSIPFFSIPSLAEKLTVMGPGEAFVDTNLTLLSEEIESISEGR